MMTYHLWRSIDYGCLDSADTYDILITVFLSLFTIPIDIIILPVEIIWCVVNMACKWLLEKVEK